MQERLQKQGLNKSIYVETGGSVEMRTGKVKIKGKRSRYE